MKAQFYSTWIYQALRILSSIPTYKNLSDLQKHFNLSERRLKMMIDFLCEHLLIKKEGDEYKPGPMHTHLPPDHPLINHHRMNWRKRALERSDHLEEDELMFSAPMSLSVEDFKVLREKIKDLISEVVARAQRSDPEMAVCLNIDWIRF